MPELPDVAIYIERLSALVLGQVLERARLKSPFLVRSFEPPLSAAEGQRVTGFRRIGKRIVFELTNDLFLVFHLMIAGRFHLKDKSDKLAGKHMLLGLEFSNVDKLLVLTEAGSKRRASLHVVRGAASLVEFSRGGIDTRIFAIDGTWQRSCTMIDVSQTGARLKVPDSIEGLSLKEFFLVLSSVGTTFRRGELSWVDGDNIGIQFLKSDIKTKKK